MLHPSYTELMDLINQDSDEDTPVVGSRYSVVMEDENEIREDMDKEIEGFLPDEQEAEKLYAEEHPGEADPFLKENSEDEHEKASDEPGAEKE